VLEKSRIPLEISSEGLAVASVDFEVNGKTLPTVSAPPFRLFYRVPTLARTPRLSITAVGRDEEGQEMARETLSVEIIPGLQREPALLGLATGGTSHLRLYISEPLEDDLAVTLTAVDPAVVRLADGEVVLKASESELLVPVEGVSEGNTVVAIRSERGSGGVVVSVNDPESGVERAIASLPLGMSIMPQVFTQPIRIPDPGTYTVSVPLVSNPVESDVPVAIASTETGVVVSPDRGVIPSGSLLLELMLEAKIQGRAELMLHVGDAVTRVPVVVGEELEPFTSGVAFRAVGMAVSEMPSCGTVLIGSTGTHKLTVPLPATIASTGAGLMVSSSDPSLVAVEGKPSLAEDGGSHTGCLFL
jgi:hypothetical protein